MEATEADIKQLYYILKLAFSRSVAACAPLSVLDGIKRVSVTLQCAEEHVSITGFPPSVFAELQSRNVAEPAKSTLSHAHRVIKNLRRA